MPSRRLVGALVPALLLSFAGSASACLWYYGTNVHGEPVTVEGVGPEAYLRHLKDDSEHARALNRSIPVPDLVPASDFKARSDYAADLVHQGEAKKALAIFEEIERDHPGEYVVATNLGTAYELSGDNEKALKWIREGIRRNKDSHYGTEWLHVRILEAKLALQKDPGWLATHSVLGVDFGRDAAPSRPAKWTDDLGGARTESALEYQLRERMAFVKPPDPVVGDLLSDLGHVLALNKTIEHAIAVYDLALQYKPAQADLVTRRRDHLQQVLDESRRWRLFKNVLLYGGGGLLGLLLLVGTLRFVRGAAPVAKKDSA